MIREAPHYRVGQISRYIKGLFANDFLLRSVLVEGEISNLKYHSSGHIYFTLKDEDGTLNAVMFAGNRGSLTFPLKDGLKIIAGGSISVYEKSGSYQLYVKTVQQSGIGDLYREYEERKRRLEEMGLFDAVYKKPIPRYSFRIGIVTAPTGAAIQDIINISRRRNPFVQLILYPALVQGAQAAPSIVKGIESLDRLGLDVIIIGRGGGSLEDLWAFNEECVARAVFDAETPIISAVGHEVDTALSDYAADLRAPTPSAAAELAVFDYREFLRLLEQKEKRLTMAASAKADQMLLQLGRLNERLRRQDPERKLSDMHMRLINDEDMLRRIMTEALNDDLNRLTDYRQELSLFMQRQAENSKHTLSLYSVKLDGISPLKRLSSGYAYVERTDGKALHSVKESVPGEDIRLHFKDGSLTAAVKEIRSHE